jgi:hypothetical protein
VAHDVYVKIARKGNLFVDRPNRGRKNARALEQTHGVGGAGLIRNVDPAPASRAARTRTSYRPNSANYCRAEQYGGDETRDPGQ